MVILVLSACGNNTNNDQASQDPAGTTAASPDSTSSASAGQAVEIKLMAKDFEYDQKEIHVKKGDKVKITLESDDGGHGFTIPDYNVKIDGNGSAEFTADKSGQFEFHCSVMCGSGHSTMKGILIVD
jgi:cytochrome c oxidase subunit 2